MSIQDESFPFDDDLEFSQNSSKNFVFPHHKPRRSKVLEEKKSNQVHEDSTKKNISSSSPLQNQDESTQSSNDLHLSSETSGKTNASEPNDLQESEKKTSEFITQSTNKSISYQDIHSEYTKKRYKHVESKVGQYIANMKAQDEKRRNSGKFQRHRSLPETLQTTVTESNNDSKKHGLIRRSTNDLHGMHNPHNNLQSNHDNDNYNNLTATTSSVSTKDLGSENGIFLDKQTYEQLLNDKERKDYLQSKLDEKNADYCRLKQNLETMRTEYSMFKEKLKQQTQPQRLAGSFGSINFATTFGGTSLQNLIYTQETREKSTQTDIVLTPSPIFPEIKQVSEMFATPFTPDANNNTFDHAAIGIFAPVVHKVGKSIATIQPLSLNFSNLVDQDFSNSNINTTMGFLRQRSNSLTVHKKSTPLPANISKSSSSTSAGPSSTDSAIDVEVVDSPKRKRQSRREEFVCYEQRSQRYSLIETSSNASQNYTNTENKKATEEVINVGGDKRNRRKRHNLRSRMMRLFQACTKCKNRNITENNNNSTQSQIPLLEKSPLDYCYNNVR